MAKKIKIGRRLVVILIALLILIPCSIWFLDMARTAGQGRAELYYMMADGRMKPIERRISGQTQEEILENTLLALKEGPKADGASPSMPARLAVLSARLEGNTAVVDLSEEYGEMDSTAETICRSSIVWTLTSLDFVENVRLEVDSAPLCNEAGAEYGLLNRQNILIDAEISADTTEYAILRLYFANAEGTDLAVEERLVEVSANQAREKTILELLIAGPLEDGHQKTIPVETKIRDITTTGDGTCYVNLSQDFIVRQNRTDANERLAVYSIVNSLCELDSVDKVQFLFEGEKLDDHKGKIDFKTPFTAVSSLKTVELQ